MPRTSDLPQNLSAFLDMIAVSELGAAILAGSDDGYNVLVGSTPAHINTFPSYAKHPGIPVKVRDGLISTAAGRYQVLKRYADSYTMQLRLPDFGPKSQDEIAIEMIHECRASADIELGNVAAAVDKCASRWASLPGASYGQHTNALADLIDAYTKSGGTVAA